MDVYEGSNGSIVLCEDGIVIRRKPGALNFLTQGLQGDKRIPFKNITAVQFRDAGAMMAGVIQFTLKGGREAANGMLAAMTDENAVLFTKAQQARMTALRGHVSRAIAEADTPAKALSSVEELTKLAELVEKGYVTRDEFDAHKRRLLRL